MKTKKYRYMVTLLLFGVIIAVLSAVADIFFSVNSDSGPFAGLIYFLWLPFALFGFLLGSIADAIPDSKYSQTEKVVKIILAIAIFCWLIYAMLGAFGYVQ